MSEPVMNKFRGFEEELMHTLNIEILRELMMETNPEVTDTEVDMYFCLGKKNPWDAKMLYDIVRIKNDNA